MELKLNLNTFCLALVGRETAIKNITKGLSKITRFKGINIAPPRN
jgi:hypothetical protein